MKISASLSPDGRRRHDHRGAVVFVPSVQPAPAAHHAGFTSRRRRYNSRRRCSRSRSHRLPQPCRDGCGGSLIPPSCGQPAAATAAPGRGAHSGVHRQQHHEHLHCGRTVGALGLRPGRVRGRLDPVCRLVGTTRSTSSTTSASGSSVASSSTSPTGLMGKSASARAWSMSASTPSTRSSSSPTTNSGSGCRRCRRCRHCRRSASVVTLSLRRRLSTRRRRRGWESGMPVACRPCSTAFSTLVNGDVNGAFRAAPG